MPADQHPADILERHVSFERMVEFKRKLLRVRQQTTQNLHTCLPTVLVQAFETLTRHVLPLIIGLWPLSHPAEVAAKVIVEPGLESLRYDFETDLEQALLALMRANPWGVVRRNESVRSAWPRRVPDFCATRGLWPGEDIRLCRIAWFIEFDSCQRNTTKR